MRLDMTDAPSNRGSTSPRIRQNPAVAAKPEPTEHCPRHGAYRRDPEVAQLRNRAIGSRGVPVDWARRLLQRAEQLRRICPACAGPRPTDREWLDGVRQREAH